MSIGVNSAYERLSSLELVFRVLELRSLKGEINHYLIAVQRDLRNSIDGYRGLVLRRPVLHTPN